MPLTSGTKLGQYEVIECVGAGGMGEVYRARDTKLGRDIAIKVLPEEFSKDKERLNRFEREARLLAQLNHANIATLHGLEEHDGQQFLVMELVERETLAEHIARGPIPIDEALSMFKQIAEGLEAAHEEGGIHRDLKPANIKVTPRGTPKILDFGLAKTFTEAPAQNLSESPTVTRGTATGVILGTAPYMSPEQARGKVVDKQTDVWAFGCVLFEALTGKATFLADTVPDTLARILEREPDWEALPLSTPPLIRSVLRRCCKKEPAERLHDIADARIEIAEALAEPATTTTVLPSGRPRRGLVTMLFVLTGVSIGVAIWSLAGGYFARDLEERGATRFAFPPPPEAIEEILEISPDGKRLASIVPNAEGVPLIWLRDLESGNAQAMAGTDGVWRVFWSPDSHSIGFTTETQLKKVGLSGEPPETLRDGQFWSGGTWNDEGVILLSANVGLYRVPAERWRTTIPWAQAVARSAESARMRSRD